MREMRCSFEDLKRTPAWVVAGFIEDFNARAWAREQNRTIGGGTTKPNKDGIQTVVTPL